MIRTGDEYRAGLRDGREIWIDGERVTDVTTHPATKPIVDIRARMYDIQHEAGHAPVLTYAENDARHSIFNRLPREQKDWHDKWGAVEALSLSDRIVVMSDGRIRQIGTPEEIYNHPADRFVASFVGAVSIFPAEGP
jgi:aromatic ring hydroxylase